MKEPKRLLILGLFVLAVMGAVFYFSSPSLAPKMEYTDVSYGDNQSQKLDIYLPVQPSREKDVILFFHGGAWQYGSRQEFSQVGKAFAQKGYIAVLAGYRLYPEAYFPDFMEDAAKALVWVHAHIDEYGGDPARIFVAGHSAGAHIAALLALDDRYITELGGRRGWITGIIGLSGVYDGIPLLDDNIQSIFSRRPAAESAPVNFAAPGMPPILLVSGEGDHVVPVEHTRHLAAALHESGNRVTVKIYQSDDHMQTLPLPPETSPARLPVMADIQEFIRTVTPR